jgi:mannose-6-phosphate isomerase-like protein (cupin superfamily)
MPATRTRPQRHLTPLTGTAPTVDPGPRLDTTTLADIVHGLAIAEDLWRPHVLHNPDERARVRLLATPAYEVWLLGWTPGQSVGLHDHGGANAAFFVVDGTLTETVAVDRTSRTLVDRSIPAGSGGAVPAGHLHDVANRSSTLATSIHAYSKPLRSMGFYDVPEPGVHGHRVRTLWVEEETAVLPGHHWLAG